LKLSRKDTARNIEVMLTHVNERADGGFTSTLPGSLLGSDRFRVFTGGDVSFNGCHAGKMGPTAGTK